MNIKRSRKRILLAIAIFLTIITLRLGMVLKVQDNGHGPINFGFPCKYITYQYSPVEGLSNYLPENITPFVWIKNIGITWSRSSLDIVGIILNIVFYYGILHFIQIMILKINVKLKAKNSK